MIEPDANGNVAIFFTDVEGSTKRWELSLEQMSASLATHDQIVRGTIESAGGYVFSVAGDSFGAIFATTEVAIDAALRIQSRIAAEAWVEGFDIKVRMSLHSGPAIQRDKGAYGPEVVRAAIVCEIGHPGQILLTEEAAQDFRLHERTNLGTHRLRKISKPQTIYQFGGDEFPTLRNVIPQSCTVPAARSSILGREEQIAELIPLLEDNRLITLLGPGGVGKTRLACEIALRLFDHSFDGVHLVDLSAVDEERDVVNAFALGLDLMLLPDSDPIDQLLAFLLNRNSLLVVDNCEHMVQSVANLVDRLLERCPKLAIIATSREALEVDGELGWRVPALEPEAAATELFLRTAQRNAGEFDTPASRHQIGRICALLDGLPLAIELAAARTRTLSVSAIATMLEQHLAALDLRSGKNSRKAGTLNDVVAWSHALLDESEQRAFRRLGVFVGGFALEDVADVIEVSPAEAFDLVDSLVSRSLIETVAAPRGDLRLRMLNTIRAFANQKLKVAGEQRQTSERHCQHFLALAERPRHPFMPSPRAADRHEAEYMNLRAAADWAASGPEPAIAARIATGCVIEIDRRGEFENGIRWAGTVSGQTDEVGFNALVTESFLRGQEGNLAVESSIAQRAVDIAGENPYRLLPVAIGLASLSSIAHDTEGSLARLESAYEVARRGDQTLLNTAFIDVHMASFDLLLRQPETLLSRMLHYAGGMVTYARVCAHILLDDPDAALSVVRAAADAPADAWVHFNSLAESLYLIHVGEYSEAATVLTTAARRDSGLRRWQDGDFLVHFAKLHLATGDTARAEFLIDNCRSRHGLISWNAVQAKQSLQGWPANHDHSDCLDWLRNHYSAAATTRILALQPGSLAEEIQRWGPSPAAD